MPVPDIPSQTKIQLPSRIALVRHGQTAWNAQRRYQGRVDLQLSPLGHLQAQSAAALLAKGHWDAVVSSPLTRAKETALAITQLLRLDEAVVDDSLIERSFGIAEGIEMDEAARRWPEGNFPRAEPLEAVAGRVSEFLARMGHNFMGRNVVVVCHVVVVREITKALTGKDPGFVENGSVTELCYVNGAPMMDLLTGFNHR